MIVCVIRVLSDMGMSQMAFFRLEVEIIPAGADHGFVHEGAFKLGRGPVCKNGLALLDIPPAQYLLPLTAETVSLPLLSHGKAGCTVGIDGILDPDGDFLVITIVVNEIRGRPDGLGLIAGTIAPGPLSGVARVASPATEIGGRGLLRNERGIDQALSVGFHGHHRHEGDKENDKRVFHKA